MKRVNRVLVVGSIETLQSQGTTDSFLQQTLVSASSSAVQFNSGANPLLLQHALDTLNPSADSGSTSELLLAHETGGNALHVTLHALPTQVSRSNSLARPHSIASFVKSHNKLVTKRGQELSKDESVLVVLMLPGHTDTWFAAGAAVARGAPLYEHKLKRSNALPGTDSKSEADKLEVVYQTALTSNESSLVQHTADAIQLATRLARAVAHRTNSKISVIQGEELRERGFGGIYGGAAADAKGVALVGKGIIFDTGGLSIKTGGIMVGMKRDMGGAASLLAAFEAACHAKNTTDKTPLHVVLCIAENSVGPDSTRVDDVLVMYSGKTVEVNNTDAEGRLYLVTVIVDMATLTGAQGISTGNCIGAIYTNDGDLEDMAVKAGKISGDLVHPMPYAPEFHRLEFKSTIADMKNSVKNRANAQVSCAGQFIANHLGDFEHTGKWLHVDMAFPVFTGDDERSTGFGVASFSHC
ncbi:Peptidase M17, leucine aminopeptidase/peptidase B [Phytophthora cactorum]|nr:Peptidase M17, leucine aminopeptidase/peptidase B [Phytophthora cactorum]